jgi:hypothetical protein
MLVMLTNNQLFSPHVVCQSCLLADHYGQPRWHQGQLSCGRQVYGVSEQQPQQYQCQMGFRIAEIANCSPNVDGF